MSDKVIATVNEGKIRGVKKISSFSGVEYCSFLGVPYAQPPVGQARFKDPVKVKPWKSVIDATTEKGGCQQFCMFQRLISGSEDCLYNNIFTSKMPSKNEPLKPVVVNIHPGGFLFGSPDPESYGSPDFLMHHNVVFVGISYRLHILGFLNLGLKECSGNQGLKDVILSLEWIRENIKSFGGDLNNITVVGSSSGGALVHCLMLSPKSKGLFHRAVIMGMYVLNPTLIHQRENVTTAFQLAKSLGYEGDDVKDKKKLLAFYKKIDIDSIIVLKPESFLEEDNAPVYPTSMFTPTFGGSENSVLPLSPEEMTKSMVSVPLIIGFCDKEAAMVFTHKYRNTIKKNFYSTIRQNSWGWGYNLCREDLKQIQKEIETFYFKGDSVENASLAIKCNVQTDIALSDVYDSVINIVAAHLPDSVFVYRFDFEGSFSTMKDRILALVKEPLEGTVHGCDYSYLCYIKEIVSGGTYTLTPKSHRMVEMFTKLICTFAKTGNPNYENMDIKWKPSTVKNPCYLSINDELKLIDGKLNGERMEFWHNLKKKFTSC